MTGTAASFFDSEDIHFSYVIITWLSLQLHVFDSIRVIGFALQFEISLSMVLYVLSGIVCNVYFHALARSKSLKLYTASLYTLPRRYVCWEAVMHHNGYVA